MGRGSANHSLSVLWKSQTRKFSIQVWAVARLFPLRMLARMNPLIRVDTDFPLTGIRDVRGDERALLTADYCGDHGVLQ